MLVSQKSKHFHVTTVKAGSSSAMSRITFRPERFLHFFQVHRCRHGPRFHFQVEASGRWSLYQSPAETGLREAMLRTQQDAFQIAGPLLLSRASTGSSLRNPLLGPSTIRDTCSRTRGRAGKLGFSPCVMGVAVAAWSKVAKTDRPLALRV